jgi:hypothetical protein
LLGGVSVGLTPSPTPTVGFVTVARFSDRWSAQLRVDLAPSQLIREGELQFGFTRATVLGCAAPLRSTLLSMTLCAGLAGALVHTAVRNAFALDAGDRPWLAATLNVGLWWNLSPRWFLSLDLGAALAIVRSTFVSLPDRSTLITQELLSGSGSLALGFRTP